MHDVVDATGGHFAQPPAPDPRLTRLDRLRDSRGWSFSGPVAGFGAAAITGFDPVGQVFGTTVVYLGPPGLGRCFVPGAASAKGGSAGAASAKGGAQTSADPHNPLLAKLTAARSLALDRAVAECRALGGDGIIEMRVSTRDFFSDTVEFTVEGTAVRARSPTRPSTPFTTHVSGQDLAKLLHAGYVPFALVFGVAIAACHFDDSMIRQTRRSVGAAGNQEVSGYTRTVNDARRQARGMLENAVRQRGGEGAVAHEATLHISERECPLFDQRTDYVAQATILGSAVISFERTGSVAPRAALSIMRLDRRSAAELESGPRPRSESRPEPGSQSESESAPGSGSGPESGPEIVPRLSVGDRAFAYWSGRGRGRAQ